AIHDGPEHYMLQSKAGYIDARPHIRQLDESSCNARLDHTLGHVWTAPPWQELSELLQHWSGAVMCGRRRLGKNFLSCCSIGRVRSCVRPVLCGGEAAGHNALRGSGPNQKHAFKDALTQTGSPDPRIDLVCITSSCPRQFLQTSNAVVVSWPHLLESLWL